MEAATEVFLARRKGEARLLEFLTKLKLLMEEYEADFDVTVRGTIELYVKYGNADLGAYVDGRTLEMDMEQEKNRMEAGHHE